LHRTDIPSHIFDPTNPFLQADTLSYLLDRVLPAMTIADDTKGDIPIRSSSSSSLPEFVFDHQVVPRRALRVILRALQLLSRHRSEIEAIPTQLTHGDLNPSNIMVDRHLIDGTPLSSDEIERRERYQRDTQTTSRSAATTRAQQRSRKEDAHQMNLLNDAMSDIDGMLSNLTTTSASSKTTMASAKNARAKKELDELAKLSSSLYKSTAVRGQGPAIVVIDFSPFNNESHLYSFAVYLYWSFVHRWDDKERRRIETESHDHKGIEPDISNDDRNNIDTPYPFNDRWAFEEMKASLLAYHSIQEIPFEQSQLIGILLVKAALRMTFSTIIFRMRAIIKHRHAIATKQPNTDNDEIPSWACHHHIHHYASILQHCMDHIDDFRFAYPRTRTK
jgi:hypothetical protein